VNNFVWGLRVPLLVLVGGLACVALHEAGHALAGWATGAHVADINILSLQPHVRINGPGSPADEALRAISGSGLVLLTWLAGILVLPRRGAWWVILQTVSFFALTEVLGWFISALLHRFQPQPNDAGTFLTISGTDPRAAVLACLLLIAAGARLAVARRPRPVRPVTEPENRLRRAAAGSSS
jgi:hypothetical protein